MFAHGVSSVPQPSHSSSSDPTASKSATLKVSLGYGRTYLATVTETPAAEHEYSVSIKQSSAFASLVNFFQDMLGRILGGTDSQMGKERNLEHVSQLAIKEYQSIATSPTQSTLSFLLPDSQNTKENHKVSRHVTDSTTPSSAQSKSTTPPLPQFSHLNEEVPPFPEAFDALHNQLITDIDIDAIANHPSVKMNKQKLYETLATAILGKPRPYTLQEKNAIRLAAYDLPEAQVERTHFSKAEKKPQATQRSDSLPLQTQLYDIQHVVLSQQDVEDLKTYLDSDNKDMGFALEFYIHHRENGRLGIDKPESIIDNPDSPPAKVVRECHKFLAQKIQASKEEARIQLANQQATPSPQMVDPIPAARREKYLETQASIQQKFYRKRITRAEFIAKAKQAGFTEDTFQIESRVAVSGRMKEMDSYDGQSTVRHIHVNIEKFNSVRMMNQLLMLNELL